MDFSGDPIDGTDELTETKQVLNCRYERVLPDGEIDCGFIDIVSDIDIFANESGGVVADCDGDGIEVGGTTTVVLLFLEKTISLHTDGSGHGGLYRRTFKQLTKMEITDETATLYGSTMRPLCRHRRPLRLWSD